jgi:hypothetical protein
MDSSSLTIVLAVVAVVLVVGGLIAYASYRKNSLRTRHLKDRFGPEYDRVASQTGVAGAERQLQAREKRAATFAIRDLSAAERQRFADNWKNVQAEFVENPQASLAHADSLLGDVMGARGYPVTDFEQQAADLSVDHPVIVQHYHTAHEIALRHRTGPVSTEDMRQAMIHYRALFDELAAVPPTAQAAE